MIKLAHISDLHFGTENLEVIEALQVELTSIIPDVIVVSGDLTQRAKNHEYNSAKKFLASTGIPYIVIPGNHDIPLYNLWGRVVNPFKKFDSYFDRADSFHKGGNVEIVGLNSVRNLRLKSGRISVDRLEKDKKDFSTSENNIIRIIVLHHNLFHRPSTADASKLFRARLMQKWAAENNIAMALFGHDHKSMVKLIDESNEGPGFILVQAGTAFSTRTRGEPNSYNLIEISEAECTIKVSECRNNKFEPVSEHHFVRKAAGWQQT